MPLSAELWSTAGGAPEKPVGDCLLAVCPQKVVVEQEEHQQAARLCSLHL